MKRSENKLSQTLLTAKTPLQEYLEPAVNRQPGFRRGTRRAGSHWISVFMCYKKKMRKNDKKNDQIIKVLEFDGDSNPLDELSKF